MSQSSKVSVSLRLRPPEDEAVPGDWKKVYQTHASDDEVIVTVLNPKDPSAPRREYLLDTFLPPDTTQQDVFKQVAKPLCDNVIAGFNGCCIAYGQTGAGKTYTVVGETEGTKGIAPRAAEYLFEQIKRNEHTKTTTVEMSFFELYLEHPYDLLTSSDASPVVKKGRQSRHDQDEGGIALPASMRAPTPPVSDKPYSAPGSARDLSHYVPKHALAVREGPEGVYVEGLKVVEVTSADEVSRMLETGMTRRATFDTRMNERSSRSHSIVFLRVTQTSK
ncbi:kinesin-like protein, partial [Kipferlia bialata]|eukprot:g11310.t1